MTSHHHLDFCRGCTRTIPAEPIILAALEAILAERWLSADGVDLLTPKVRHVLNLQMDLVRQGRISGNPMLYLQTQGSVV